jgi:hypothetical protein
VLNNIEAMRWAVESVADVERIKVDQRATGAPVAVDERVDGFE